MWEWLKRLIDRRKIYWSVFNPREGCNWKYRRLDNGRIEVTTENGVVTYVRVAPAGSSETIKEMAAPKIVSVSTPRAFIEAGERAMLRSMLRGFLEIVEVRHTLRLTCSVCGETEQYSANDDTASYDFTLKCFVSRGWSIRNQKPICPECEAKSGGVIG